MTAREIVQELSSTKCRCGRQKQPRQSFCRACYYSLPLNVRNELYQRVAYDSKGMISMKAGYVQAFMNAVHALQVSRP